VAGPHVFVAELVEIEAETHWGVRFTAHNFGFGLEAPSVRLQRFDQSFRLDSGAP
jgi:hypothetical protein